MTRLAAAAAALLHFATWRPSSAAPQPYPTLGPGDYSGPPTPASRDPLVRYRWDVGADAGRLQIFASPPASAAAAPPGAATGLRTLITSPYGEGAAIVVGPASVMLDFGLELPAWLEVAVPGGVPPGVDVRLGISEYDAHRAASVGPPTAAPVAYDGGTTLRLETTPLLFDGLRYAWLDVGCAAPPCAPLAVSGVRAVAQVLPLNYTGAFASDDATLDAIWYTGAYSTRVNAQPGFLGSELLSRGDRAPPFQGDAHVAQAAGLAAFGSPPLYALAAAMLNVTDSAAHAVHDSNIATYPLLWVLSVADFYVATGDARVFAAFAADAAAILDAALANFNTTLPVDLRWSGWDSRLGSGFSNVNQTPEARRYYRMTTLRASAGFAAACRAAGGAFDRYAVAFDAAVTAAAARLRAAGGPQWYVTGRYGLHAMAAAINGGWTTADERAGAFHLFNDSARVCSLSNFDSGFILNAFGVMGRVDFGLAMLRQCWGSILSAGATCWWESTQPVGMLTTPNASSGGPPGDMDVLHGASTSACHAWGSAPTAWLPRYALGVAPLLPGFESFSFAPGAVGLGGAPWTHRVSGVVPTPDGPVTASAEAAAVGVGGGGSGAVVMRARLSLSLSHPRGAQPTVIIPVQLPEAAAPGDCGPLVLAALSVNGAPVDVSVDVERGVDAAGRATAELPPAVLLAGRTAPGSGAHTVEAEYARGASPCGGRNAGVTVGRPPAADSAAAAAAHGGAAAVAARATGASVLAAATLFYPPFGPPLWPSVVSVDNATHGDWVRNGTLGRAGYVLFAFDAGGSDRVALPPFVSSVAASPAAVRTRLGPAAAGSLQDPAAPGGPRGLGAVSASGTGALYTMWVDVNVLPGAERPYRLGVYVADTAPAGGAPAAVVVRVEDLDTRNAVAPDVLLRRYVAPPAYGGGAPPAYNGGGLWGLETGVTVLVNVTASARVRLFCASGCYASASALFFD